MANSLAAKYIQYSKKLTTSVMVFWMTLRIVSVILVTINPDAGGTIVNLMHGADDIAMINVLAYTGNSVSQKISTSYFNYKAKTLQSEQQEQENEQSNG